MCVIDECFDLAPPAWLKQEWLANPRSTALFQKYVRNSPSIWPRNTSTHQGFYIMTADGEHLAGSFARTGRDEAERLMRSSLTKVNQLARQRGWSPKPVPTNRFPLTMGKPSPRGGIKLEAVTRDLPRGRDTRPGGNNQWVKEWFNLNWVDLTPDEARSFVASGSNRQAVPRAVLEKIAMANVKDTVRGQNGWKKGAFKGGELYTELTGQSGSTKSLRISGYVIMSGASRVLAVQLHGRAKFDQRAGEFREFEMVASGQRQGAADANMRGQDPGPAPMGIAWRLYASK